VGAECRVAVRRSGSFFAARGSVAAVLLAASFLPALRAAGGGSGVSLLAEGGAAGGSAACFLSEGRTVAGSTASFLPAGRAAGATSAGLAAGRGRAAGPGRFCGGGVCGAV